MILKKHKGRTSAFDILRFIGVTALDRLTDVMAYIIKVQL